MGTVLTGEFGSAGLHERDASMPRLCPHSRLPCRPLPFCPFPPNPKAAPPRQGVCCSRRAVPAPSQLREARHQLPPVKESGTRRGRSTRPARLEETFFGSSRSIPLERAAGQAQTFRPLHFPLVGDPGARSAFELRLLLCDVFWDKA